MGLIRDLDAGPVALDTVAFIYFIEEHPRFLPVVEPLFQEIDTGRLQAFTSSLTLLEVLVVPYREADLSLARRYEEILARSRGINMVEIDREQIHAAALLRSRYRLRTPDALQVAVALTNECKAFITNDREIPDISGLKTLMLRDYLE
jgi:predicted nucleic acid-binding protein